MTDQAISPLRRRMIEDMTVRGFTADTQRGYIVAVRRFTVFLGRSPDQATAEDFRRFQLQMRAEGASATTMNAVVSALRFFFGVTLGRGVCGPGPIRQADQVEPGKGGHRVTRHRACYNLSRGIGSSKFIRWRRTGRG
jgi:site-specific recombinase XerD